MLLAVVATTSGCEAVSRYTAGVPGDGLAQAVPARLAVPGRPLLDGISGRDTVASVSPTGARAWEAAVIPAGGGSPVVWSLEVTRADVYVTPPGEAFRAFLTERSQALGVERPVPEELLEAMASGAIRAVGALEIRYGLAQRTERRVERRVALLTSPDAGGVAEWRIQDRSRPGNALLLALQAVAEDMLSADGEARACVGGDDPGSVSHQRRLDCVARLWTQRFGAGR